MKTGSIQLQTKGAKYIVNVPLVDDNGEPCGNAKLTLNVKDSVIEERFENIIKLIIRK